MGVSTGIVCARLGKGWTIRAVLSFSANKRSDLNEYDFELAKTNSIAQIIHPFLERDIKVWIISNNLEILDIQNVGEYNFLTFQWSPPNHTPNK